MINKKKLKHVPFNLFICLTSWFVPFLLITTWEDAFVINEYSPSALEAIAMELGASKDGYSIKDAIYKLKPED
jgi:hypothetical protein